MKNQCGVYTNINLLLCYITQCKSLFDYLQVFNIQKKYLESTDVHISLYNWEQITCGKINLVHKFFTSNTINVIGTSHDKSKKKCT